MTGLRSAVSCFDRLFDKASCDKYFLSIRFQPDGLFFSVFDTVNRKYIGFESAILNGVTEIYDYVRLHGFLTNIFQKTVCIIPSAKFTMLPDSLYLPDKQTEYFSFVHDLATNEELKTMKISMDEARIVYAADMVYFEIIQEFFPSSEIMPGVASFINYVVPRYRNTAEPLLFLNLYIDNFDILIMDKGKLLFCNNFNWNAPEDIVYYTIFVIDQLKVNPEKVIAGISGNISAKSDIIRLMRKYIKSVDVLTYDQEVQLSYALSEIHLYNYPDLFNPRLCE